MLDRREARVDLADGLVAEVEQVGVEERQVVVRLARAGHVRAHDAAVRVRVILVLGASGAAEHEVRKVRDVARGEHVVAAVDASVLVDDDAVVDREPGASASATFGTMPSPPTTASASSVCPEPVRTVSPSTASTVSSLRSSTPLSR